MNILIIDSYTCFIEKINFDIISHHFSNINYTKRYDFIFLDIKLDYLHNGIEITSQFRRKNMSSHIIFVSSYIEYIHDTLFLNPYYFIRKKEYKKDLKTFMNMLERKNYLNQGITLKYKNEKKRIHINYIIFIEAQGHQIKIVTNKKTYYDNRSMKDILNLIDDDRFIQIHKGYIINIEAVHYYTSKSILLKNGRELNIGRKYKDSFFFKIK